MGGELIGKLFYRIADAVGTLSIFFLITEGFEWKFLIALIVASAVGAMLPYELRKVER